jgi:chromosome partitioning protein
MLNKPECIAFANPKGGSGKTTSCLSIAGYLAKSGNKVLVVDFDPQASATSGLGIDSTSLHHSVYDAILTQCGGYEGLPISQVVLKTNIKNLHLAPSEPDLAAAEILMQRTKKRTSILKRILGDVITQYDYILIDLPPGLGLLMINGLCAASQVIVPLDASIYSLEALDNLKTLFSDIKRINGRTFNQITAILIRYVKPDIISRLVRRSNPSQEVEIKLREMFGTLYVIPDSKDIYESQRQGVPLSHLSTGGQAGKAYAEIARNISSNNNHGNI